MKGECGRVNGIKARCRLSKAAYRALFFAWWLGSMALSIYGQKDVLNDTNGKPVRIFSVMAYGDDFFHGIKFVNAEEERVDLEFRPDRRSKIYSHPLEEKRIRFFREVIDEEGVVRDMTVAEADVEGIEERGLIIFLDEQRHDAMYPYSLCVADESSNVFAGGSFRFLNLCNTDLYWRIGGESAEVTSGFSPVVSYKPEDRTPRPIALAVRVGEEWKIVFSTRSQSHPENGTLFIVKPPPTPGSLHVHVHALRDRLFPIQR